MKVLECGKWMEQYSWWMFNDNQSKRFRFRIDQAQALRTHIR